MDELAPDGHIVPPRYVPLPGAASAELRAAIAAEMPRTQTEFPVDHQGWRHFFGDPALRVAAVEARATRAGLHIAPLILGGIACLSIAAAGAASVDGPILLNLHGGGYVTGSGRGGAMEAVLMAEASGFPVIFADYRLAPEHPFPAAIDDVAAAWRAMSERRNPAHIGLFGTSAGGALALALVQRERRDRFPLPAAVAAITPWSDLSKTGDSYYINDLGRHRYDGLLAKMASLYAGEQALTDPRVSPVYGDFSGFPPTFIASGTRDLFLSNSVRVHERLLHAGAETGLHIIEGLPHGYHLIPDLPESAALFGRIAAFFAAHLVQATTVR